MHTRVSVAAPGEPEAETLEEIRDVVDAARVLQGLNREARGRGRLDRQVELMPRSSHGRRGAINVARQPSEQHLLDREHPLVFPYVQDAADQHHGHSGCIGELSQFPIVRDSRRVSPKMVDPTDFPVLAGESLRS